MGCPDKIKIKMTLPSKNDMFANIAVFNYNRTIILIIIILGNFGGKICLKTEALDSSFSYHI